MPMNSMQINSTRISLHRQSNGLTLTSASILALNPKYHHPGCTTGISTQPMDEEELTLARKLEEMDM